MITNAYWTYCRLSSLIRKQVPKMENEEGYGGYNRVPDLDCY